MMNTATKSIPRVLARIPVIGIKFPIKLENSLLPASSREKLINETGFQFEIRRSYYNGLFNRLGAESNRVLGDAGRGR